MAGGAPVPRKSYLHLIITGFLLVLFMVDIFVPPNTANQLGVPWSNVMRWIIGAVILALIGVVIGHRTQGRFDGIFIDERNKISLSRFQLVLWTIILLTTLSVIAGMRLNAPLTAQDATNFTLPQTLYLLAGISIGSATLSPAIRNGTQANKNPNVDKIKAENPLTARALDDHTISVTGNVVNNEDTHSAEWADMIRSELVGSENAVDISKLQNFMFTVIVVIIYVMAILQSIGAGVTDKIPDFSETMITLLSISHAGYLISKATQSVPQQS